QTGSSACLMPAAVSWRRSTSIVMPSSFGASGQITMPSRQNPTLVMVPSEIRPVSSTSRPSSKPAARAISRNRPWPQLPTCLSRASGPLELHGGHRVPAARHVLRPANRDDQPGPVAVDADAGIEPTAQSMPDPGADLLPAQRPPVHLLVCRLQPRQVQTKAARPAAADLHRREMAPPLMVQ